MNNKTTISDYKIRGNCSLFVCRCCRTKYGWEHQNWCELKSLSQPLCGDCRYYSNENKCIHPAANKLRKEEYAV